jgi:hypothetical protein
MARKKKLKEVPVGRRFFLKRRVDSSGVSGVGFVAFGVEMPSRKIVLEWLSEHTSDAIYETLEDCLAIHGHGGNTVVEWIDGLHFTMKNE